MGDTVGVNDFFMEDNSFLLTNPFFLNYTNKV